ncbi:MAG: hypothetical protein H0V16_02125 [Burkholderiaceae bacterium]|nr:hypothetical protein [Burkholderiaceae bacterium]
MVFGFFLAVALPERTLSLSNELFHLVKLAEQRFSDVDQHANLLVQIVKLCDDITCTFLVGRRAYPGWMLQIADGSHRITNQVIA